MCAKCPEGLSTKAEGAVECIDITEAEKVKNNEVTAGLITRENLSIHQ